MHFKNSKGNLKKIERLQTLLASGYKPNQIGRVIAYTQSVASAFVMESFYLKFVGYSHKVTNAVWAIITKISEQKATGNCALSKTKRNR
ncbi:MAG: hypothetical protein HLUCCO02_05475 [Idiomarinaceae bacterium HL-53]|nr:MAG: hypothetical protein HLUCCO02_05475 [Idiomarinaceae bacterium HL-53]